MMAGEGVRIKTARGCGGIVENVIARNIVMRNIVYEATVIEDMFYESLPPEPVSERKHQPLEGLRI